MFEGTLHLVSAYRCISVARAPTRLRASFVWKMRAGMSYDGRPPPEHRQSLLVGNNPNSN